MKPITPLSPDVLIALASALAGQTLGQLAARASLKIPERASAAKGWIGQLLEYHLGAEAGSKAVPDFPALGIELKSIPVNAVGHPLETTYVTTVNLDSLPGQTWETSPVYQKLRQVLWVPVEGDPKIPLAARRVGQAILWTPTVEQAQVLQQDWQDLVELILLGDFESLTSQLGTYLHVRPKAAHGKILQKTEHHAHTLTRGFYLRTSLTREIVK
jgi:DNA mismatch repair protein MutH